MTIYNKSGYRHGKHVHFELLMSCTSQLSGSDGLVTLPLSYMPRNTFCGTLVWQKDEADKVFSPYVLAEQRTYNQTTYATFLQGVSTTVPANQWLGIIADYVIA